jgi:hypothetical protein
MANAAAAFGVPGLPYEYKHKAKQEFGPYNAADNPDQQKRGDSGLYGKFNLSREEVIGLRTAP